MYYTLKQENGYDNLPPSEGYCHFPNITKLPFLFYKNKKDIKKRMEVLNGKFGFSFELVTLTFDDIKKLWTKENFIEYFGKDSINDYQKWIEAIKNL